MALRISRIVGLMFIAAMLTGAIGCKKPKVQLQVSRTQVQQGEDVRVTWISKDAKAVTINGETVDRTGSKIYNPDNTTTYTAVASRGKKLARDSKVVAVTPRPPRPTISVTVDQSAITRGQSTTLRWNSNNADTVTITDLGTVPSTGTRTISPGQSTTYTATATGPGGTDTASARLTVTEEPAPVDPSRPRTTTTATPGMTTIFNQNVQTIYFDYDSAELREEAKANLRRAASWLTQTPFRTVVFRIEGNCDPRGTEEYNIGLGERRAQAAKEFLVSLGVEAGRISAVSYGEERASGTSEGSWANDRRDDFIYVSGGVPPRSN